MIIDDAIEVLKIEAQSLIDLTKKIDLSFETLVNDICNSTGRVIISGIGKSGLIGRKIAATMSSTGTNSMFLHPVEAVHGDLGMVSQADIFIAISNSGETSELNQLLPVIRDVGCRMAGFTGNRNSTMAGFCDLVIDTGVEKEACPLNMAPTSSTTAQLAMGDALAVALIKKKKFQKSDFFRSHPGGALGQRLSCRVEELMLSTESAPCIKPGATMTQAIFCMDEYRLGVVLVVDRENKLIGILTDGDIRHCIAKGDQDFKTTTVDDFMTNAPLCLGPKAYLYDALNIMEKHEITVLPIVGQDNQLSGLLHLHDILGKGTFKFNGGSQ
ncbi:MAG: KpsF/GutQ family sugar-phosphate isomerase [Desulfobacter sp.]|nr:KpsF/GutQ family sugar-phosphate isomerase [Desulfobacter sp.]WDP86373.1 MAG: KpsF/GutQ family sugar-phosphate isomerase [Desulfobacter sp.]